MRILVSYNPKTDRFNTNYNEDRFHPRQLFTYDHYGHLLVQYLYIVDKHVFFNYKTYSKYLNKHYKTQKPPLRTKIGDVVIALGKFIKFGKKPKVIYVYRDRYPYWKDRY